MKRLLILTLSVCLLPATIASAATADFATAELPQIASALADGETLRLAGVPLDNGAATNTLVLERFQVFAPDAKITVHGENGDTVLPAPANVYFRGYVEGQPASRAFLTVRAVGGMRGLVMDSGRYWVLGGGAAARGPAVGLAVREIDTATEFAEQTSGFRCGASELGGAKNEILDAVFAAPRPAALGVPPKASYTARIAIETDWEFYNDFGNSTDATDYIGDVIGYSSVVYDDEVDTSLLVSSVSLWSTAGDPWVQFSTTCGLMEFGREWNTNQTGNDRTLAHFMSGKNNGGGVAWVGVLCSAGFSATLSNFGLSCSGLPNTAQYGGGYGYSGDLDTNFDIDNPSVVWDIVVVAHELGHNFNSPHGHCYENIGGNASSVDECNNSQCGQTGCHCGASSLPCPGGNQGCGTIMSYCHLLGGGLSNIGFTFGQGHPWGVAPERIPARMNAHVVSTASSNPSCLAFVPSAEEIFGDGFEAGNTSAWSSTVP